MSDIKEEQILVESMAVMMRGQLRCNYHKELLDLRDCDDLISEIKDHIAQLAGMLQLEDDDGFDIARWRRKCADIANTAALLADKA